VNKQGDKHARKRNLKNAGGCRRRGGGRSREGGVASKQKTTQSHKWAQEIFVLGLGYNLIFAV